MDVDAFLKENMNDNQKDSKKYNKKDNIKLETPGFWRRFFAFFFDLIILYVLVYETVFIAILKKINFSLTDSTVSSNTIFMNSSLFVSETLVLGMFFLGIVSIVYFSLLEYSVGWTLGMKLMNIRVYGKTTFFRCLIRNSYILPFFPFTIFWIADPLFLIFRKKRLLEIITSTETIMDKQIISE